MGGVMQSIDSSICAVVPVYNAEKTLAELVLKLEEVLSRFKDSRIVLVDDGSGDGSAGIMDSLCNDYENITAVRLTKNFGQQSALLCGLKFSQGDYTVIIDDDLEQEPADIITLYEEMLKGYDVVYGVSSGRAEKGLFRRLGSAARDLLFGGITHKPKGVKVCSFRIMSRALVESVLKADTRFVYISLEIFKAAAKARSVEVRYNPSVRSGYRPLALIKLLLKMIVYYAPGPLKVFRREGVCYQIKEVTTGKEKR